MLLTSLSTRALFAGFGAILIWSLAPAVTKLEGSSLPLSYFLLLRYGFSSLLLLPVLIKIQPSRLEKAPMLWLGLIVCLGIYLALQVVAVRHLPVSWYVVFFTLTPAVSLLLLRIRMNFLTVAGLVGAILGSLFFIQDLSWDSLPLWGFFCLFVSMLGWASMTLLIKKLQGGLNDLQVTTVCNFIPLVIFTGYWLVDGCPVVPLSLGDSALVLTLSLGMPLAFFLFAYSLRYTPVVAVASQFLEPVFGVLSGILLFHEVLSAWQIAGSALILASSYCIMRIKT